eukprot:2507784-Ditylum_brightwellii.AAC.1
MERLTPPRTCQHASSEPFLMLPKHTCQPHRIPTGTSKILMHAGPDPSDSDQSFDTSFGALSCAYTH